MKKSLCAAALASALIVGAVGWGAAAKTTIRYVASFAQNDDLICKRLIAAFEKQNPDIKVKYENWVGKDIINTFVNQMVAGVGPDVLWVDRQWAASMASKNLFADLTPYLTAAKDASDFYPIALNYFKMNKTLYALPWWLASSGLYYNKTIVNQSGVGAPTDDWTWDDLVAAGKKMTKKSPAGVTVQHGYTPDGFSLDWATGPSIWVWSNGGDILKSDETKFALADTKARQALKYYSDVIFKSGCSVTPADHAKKNWWDRFFQGTVGIWDSPSWNNSSMISVRFPWDIAPTAKSPYSGTRSAFIHVRGNAMSAGSKNKKAAWRFTQFMSSDLAQNVWSKDAGYQPVRKSSSKYWLKEFKPAGMTVNLQVFADSAKDANIIPTIPNAYKNERFWTLLDTEWAKVMAQKMSVDEFVTSVEPKANAILALKMK